MTNPIEFAINRSRLLRYLRLQAILGCGFAAILPAFMLAPAIFSVIAPSTNFHPWSSRIGLGVISFLVSTSLSLCITGLMYVGYFRKAARLESENVRLLVEGAYLRYISGSYFVSDRRIHFREVGDYCIHTGPLLNRLGMKTVSFQLSNKRPEARIRVAGLIDPESVRDRLCAFDAERSNDH